MKYLDYFEKMAQLAIFNTDEKKIKEILGSDSHSIRMKISNKKNFTDTTKVVSLENRE
ncbi:hypothetical protein O6D23_02925 [Legionella pneumophila]|uniref:hypothetical protein n=1 Tax=Legionella pneumophila TaxID=446 RepID=UPI0022B3A800|nr:hypothetical protein [Legionella pneumophila]MCZ4786708.1 hypothetical protein [Legionella pneumophila]